MNELAIGKAGEHLVCFDLLCQGVEAFLSAQGLPFDVVAVYEGKTYRIQVKTMTKPRYDKYIYMLRFGKSGKRMGYSGLVDIIAFVALDTKEVGYMKACNCKSAIEFMITSKRGTYDSETKMAKIQKALDFANTFPHESSWSISRKFGISDKNLHRIRKTGEYQCRWELNYFDDHPFEKAISC